jgi:hypothetical protein
MDPSTDICWDLHGLAHRHIIPSLLTACLGTNNNILPLRYIDNNGPAETVPAHDVSPPDTKCLDVYARIEVTCASI